MHNGRLATRVRSYAGLIATIVNTDTGELKVRHRGGYDYQTGSARYYNRTNHAFSTEDVLAALCDELDKWEGNWKIRTISTPQSVLMDLQGRQCGNFNARPSPLEPMMLTRVGRIDLWEGAHARPDKARERARKRRDA